MLYELKKLSGADVEMLQAWYRLIMFVDLKVNDIKSISTFILFLSLAHAVAFRMKAFIANLSVLKLTMLKQLSNQNFALALI